MIPEGVPCGHISQLQPRRLRYRESVQSSDGHGLRGRLNNVTHVPRRRLYRLRGPSRFPITRPPLGAGYREHDDALLRRMIDHHIGKPAEPITTGSVLMGRPAIGMRDDLHLGMVELRENGRGGLSVPLRIPPTGLPHFDERFRMKLKRWVAHRRRSSAGRGAREWS
jgi:hypothetical protein